MDPEEIDVIIDANGKVQIKVRGIKGQSCLAVTKRLEELLGGELIGRDMTYEAQEQESTYLSDEQRLGY